MRARRNVLGGCRTYERTFHTETDFLKFAGTRYQDGLIDLVHAVPGGATDMISIDFEIIKQPEPPPKAKGAAASQ